MDRRQLSQLLRYIVATAREFGGFVTTIRLVKFVYLVDLEYQRRYGRTLTGLPWRFHHYGPYAFEFGDLSRLCGYDLEREEFVDARGHQGTLLYAPQDEEFPEGLRMTTRMIVDGLVEKWADRDTADLLDYVYRTEPIRRGQRGAPLDWSVVPRGTRYYQVVPPSISEAVVRQLRETVATGSEDDVELPCSVPSGPSDVLYRGLADLEAWEEGPVLPEGTTLSLSPADVARLTSIGDE
jgi:hypothetical protein